MAFLMKSKLTIIVISTHVLAFPSLVRSYKDDVTGTVRRPRRQSDWPMIWTVKEMKTLKRMDEKKFTPPFFKKMKLEES